MDYFSNKTFDFNIEIKLLQSIFYNPKILEELENDVQINDFHDDRNREIYSLMLDVYKINKSLDIDIFMSYVKQKNKLNAIGNEEYIFDVIENTISSNSYEDYAERIKELSNIRKIVEMSEITIKNAVNGSQDSITLIDKIGNDIDKISSRKGINEILKLSDIAISYIDDLGNNSYSKKVVKTNYEDFDNMLQGGIHNSDLVILAARPGMGKTAFALNLALNVSKSKNVLVFTLEMGLDQLVERMISMITEVTLSKLRENTFSDIEFREILSSMDIIKNCKLNIANVHNVTIKDIKIMARKLKRNGQLDLIIIDYLQLIENAGNDANRVQQVSEISRSLKLLAKELDIPVIALSQLSRGVESRTDKRPMLSDLRESGSIEQDADIVMFLYREEYYAKAENTDTNSNTKGNVVELLIKKHRHGSQGTVYFKFIPECQKFNTATVNEIQAYTSMVKPSN